MANKVSYQKAFELFKAAGFDDSKAHEAVRGQVKAGLVSEQKVGGGGEARLITSKQYNRTYLDLGDGGRWVALNSGPTLTEQGKARLAQIKAQLAALDESVIVDVSKPETETK